MNVLVLGGGGREHALSWKIAQSTQLDKLYVAPGNAGTHKIATNVDISPGDFEAVGRFAVDKQIEMVVVGPEAPLVAGIHDYFSREESLRHIQIIGPPAKAAQLEGSKDFAKDFMQRHNIPTARHLTVSLNTIEQGYDFLKKHKPPYVLKADGLAGGKGVLILNEETEARKELAGMLEGKFGKASSKVVLEEYLQGVEISVFVLTDGKNYLLLPEAKDYKRIGEHDTGLNTGGMGSVSPVPFADSAFMDKVKSRIIEPTIKGIEADELNYRGFIFFGLININGEPYMIEYNCRMGDPEAEVVIPRIETDLLTLFQSVAAGKLADEHIAFKKDAAVAVMLVSGGYPGKYEKNLPIKGLKAVQDSIVFHAGTKIAKNKVLTDGGRVIAVTALAGSLKKALEQSYADVRKIMFDKAYYRHDIGYDL